MSDATPAAAPAAAPAQSSANPVERATAEAISTLPQDSKKAPEAKGDDVPEDNGADLTPEETKAAKRAYKLKVGGKDVEVDESELLKRAQMGYSADEKWQEAAKMRKQMDSFIGLLQKDPAKALEQMGFNVDELAENRIQQRIEEMKKSPEQLANEKMERELADIKAEREQEKESARQQEMTRLQDSFAVEIENDISSALDNNSFGFPKSPYVVKRIADTMILAMQHGYTDVKAKDVLGIVQDEIKRELHEMYTSSPDEVFEQLVGKDRLNKYRRSKIKKTNKPAAMSDVKSTGTKELQQAKDEASKAQAKIKSKDFFSKLGSR